MVDQVAAYLFVGIVVICGIGVVALLIPFNANPKKKKQTEQERRDELGAEIFSYVATAAIIGFMAYAIMT